MLNITGTRHNPDPSFRYRMPPIEIKIEGRGNGIRTVVSNITAIADALNRPPDLILRYFGLELGTQSTWTSDPDTLGAGKGHVNGVHTTAVLQSALGRFQELVVLCNNCRLPETVLGVSRAGVVRQTCSACGTRAPVPDDHKIVKRIQQIAKTARSAAVAVAAAE